MVSHHLSAVALDIAELDDSDAAVERGLSEFLHQAAMRDALRTISVEATHAALHTLDTNGIAFVVIKGPAVARFYAEPHKRSFSDLDLIVSPARFRDAIDVLVTLGYERKSDSEAHWESFDRHCVEGFNFHLSPIGNIDLHHHISPWRFGRGLDFDTLAGRSDPGEISGVSVRFASACDALVISSLHVINDLGKDDPSYNSWRDIAVLYDQLPDGDFSRAFKEAGLQWFEPYIVAGLAQLRADIEAAESEARSRPSSDRSVDRLALGLMGWNHPSFLTRHPLGWSLRLPTVRALYFLAGAAVPSPTYIRQRYPWYADWRDAWNSVWACVPRIGFSP